MTTDIKKMREEFEAWHKSTHKGCDYSLQWDGSYDDWGIDISFNGYQAGRAAAEHDRHELQKDGKHPAPCARHCEAKAFEIEIRKLKAQLAAAEQDTFLGYADALHIENYERGRADGVYVVRHPNGLDDPVKIYIRHMKGQS